MVLNYTKFDVLLEVFPEFVKGIHLFLISTSELTIALFSFIFVFREKLFFILGRRVEGNQKINSFIK